MSSPELIPEDEKNMAVLLTKLLMKIEAIEDRLKKIEDNIHGRVRLLERVVGGIVIIGIVFAARSWS